MPRPAASARAVQLRRGHDRWQGDDGAVPNLPPNQGEERMTTRDLLGKWLAPDAKNLRAIELWTSYYRDCDAFDGTTGPVPPWRQGDSSAYALRRRREMVAQAMAEGIPDDVMTSARDRALDEYEESAAGRPLHPTKGRSE